MPTDSRPLRRDAERNRRLVLATAQTLIAQRGLGVTHEEIARAAGVGMGTVYRRFPAKQDLVDALFNAHIDAVVRLAEDASKAKDAWGGLVDFMTNNLEMQAQNRGLRELLRHGRQNSDLVRDARERITPIVIDLVRRAHAAGQLAADVAPGDFELVELMVTGVMAAERPVEQNIWRRALAIALAGLREGHRLPGTPPDGAAIDRLYGADAGKPNSRGPSPIRSRLA